MALGSRFGAVGVRLCTEKNDLLLKNGASADAMVAGGQEQLGPQRGVPRDLERYISHEGAYEYI